MSSFYCPCRSKTFVLKGTWVYHLTHNYGLELVSMNPTVASPLQTTTSGPTVSTSSTSPVAGSGTSPTLGHLKARPKLSFEVAYDLGQGDEAQPIRGTVPKNESYAEFLWRLHHVFYGETFERSLHQWEYILVNHRYEKGGKYIPRTLFFFRTTDSFANRETGFGPIAQTSVLQRRMLTPNSIQLRCR